MRRILPFLVVLLILPTLALAQSKEQWPTGNQYLINQLSTAEARVAQMLDRIVELEKTLAEARAAKAEAEKKK